MAVAALALVVGVAVGACIEAHLHRCPGPDAGLLARLDQAQALARQWRSWGLHQAEAAVTYRRAARKWAAQAEKHRVVLRALGRVVAEGGSVVEDEAA